MTNVTSRVLGHGSRLLLHNPPDFCFYGDPVTDPSDTGGLPRDIGVTVSGKYVYKPGSRKIRRGEEVSKCRLGPDYMALDPSV